MTDSLLSRLQALTGPSREIDAEIALANGWTWINSGIPPSSADPYWRGPHGQIQPGVPRYTASIDAALTLMPEDTYWIVGAGMTRPREPLYGAQIMRADMRTVDLIGEGESDATPAIALCIAFEKAKEAAKQEMEETKP